MINPNNVFLAFLNADSLTPDVYFDHGRIYHQELRTRHMYIYQPLQIFTRNNLNVPVFTRVYNVMHSFAHCFNHNSVFYFPSRSPTMPWLTISMIKRILGYLCRWYWRRFLYYSKSFLENWWLDNHCSSLCPFNQVNIETGNGYAEDVKVRFWKAEQHGQGVADVENSKCCSTKSSDWWIWWYSTKCSKLLSCLQSCLGSSSPWCS